MVIDGNVATGMLIAHDDEGTRKTRVVARQLESLGFKTTIVERPFDSNFHRGVEEPGTALAGFDKPEPRQILGDAGFSRVVDAGLGHGPNGYLSMVLHTFPSSLDPKSEFEVQESTETPLAPPFEDAVERLVEQGEPEGAARCGVVLVAGISIAAAFVGSIAAALAVGDLVRALHSGREFAMVRLDLRSPDYLRCSYNLQPPEDINPGTAGAQ